MWRKLEIIMKKRKTQNMSDYIDIGFIVTTSNYKVTIIGKSNFSLWFVISAVSCPRQNMFSFTWNFSPTATETHRWYLEVGVVLKFSPLLSGGIQWCPFILINSFQVVFKLVLIKPFIKIIIFKNTDSTCALHVLLFLSYFWKSWLFSSNLQTH